MSEKRDVLNGNETATRELKPYLGFWAAWAFALGTSVGWGSMVITGNTYLAQAGPAGSIAGVVIGAIVMLIISRSYHYMMECSPNAGGAYSFVKEIFSHDHGFVIAWFLLLAYLAVYWANATSLPLFARYFFGNYFQFGIRYEFLGYELYFGEALLSVAAILLTSLLCTLSPKHIARIMLILGIVIMVGVTLSVSSGLICYDNEAFAFAPAFVPDSGKPWFQIIFIACISPWAFIGFENISHSAEEFKFSRAKSYHLLALAVISAAAVYIFVILLSVTAYPPEYSSWLEYIRDLENLSGIKALPPFYAVHHYWGNIGLGILTAALFALVMTSLIGNIIAISRLIYSLSRDRLIPPAFSKLNKNNVPSNAIFLVAGISLIIPFLGRTAIGWIVDVTTISATLIYASVSGAAASMAKRRNDKKEFASGMIGIAVMIFFAGFVLLPNLFSVGSMAKESYILFTVWSVLGFIVFHRILKTDHEHRFGKSIVVWIVLQAMILFSALVWLNQSTLIATNKVISDVQVNYVNVMSGVPELLEGYLSDLRQGIIQHMTIVVVLFAISLFMMLNNYRIMSRRANESEKQLGNIRESAYRDPLTGVKSKLALNEKISEINDHINEGKAEIFAVAVCDVNGLKVINDTLGHKAGDEYLKRACMLVCKAFQHSPVYRLGGDEFVVFIAGMDFDHRHEILNDLNKTIEENIAKKEAVISIGISDYVASTDECFNDVMERADVNMYTRKSILKSMGASTRT